jgi:hypothetical protein
MQQCVAVHAAVCGSACGSVRLSGSAAVCGSVLQCARLCAAVHAAVYVRGSARGSVWQCVRQSGGVHGSSVRLTSGAAVCGSAATRRSILYHTRQTAPSCTASLTILYPYAVACPLLQPVTPYRTYISCTGCRSQTAPSCTASLTTYIHTRYKPSLSCNLLLRIISYTNCRGHTYSPLLHHVAHNIHSYAVACPLLLQSVAP